MFFQYIFNFLAKMGKLTYISISNFVYKRERNQIMYRITKGKLFLILTAAVLAGVLSGEEKTPPAPALSSREIARNEQAAKLKEERDKLLLTMHYTRIRLIQNESRLATLQREIIRRSRELAIEINATAEMIYLNDRLAKLDAKIEDLSNDKKGKSGDKK